MTFHPVLPPVLLAVLAAMIIVARIVALRRPGVNTTVTRTRSALWRWCGITLAALLFLVAAARPVIGDDTQGTARVAGDTEPNVFLVVDRSPDMAVPDLDNRTRVAVAQEDLTALIDRYPNARFAVISFAARAGLDWPLSADTFSLPPVLAALTPFPEDPDALEETNVGAASNVLRYQIIGASQQYPRAQNLVFYLGAGPSESDAAPRKFEPPEDSIDGGAVLGYGVAAEGGPALRDVAAQLGVPFVPRVDAAPLDSVLPNTESAGGAVSARILADGRAETYWLPAGIAAVLILIELYLKLRELRRARLTAEVSP